MNITAIAIQVMQAIAGSGRRQKDAMIRTTRLGRTRTCTWNSNLKAAASLSRDASATRFNRDVRLSGRLLRQARLRAAAEDTEAQEKVCRNRFAIQVSDFS